MLRIGEALPLFSYASGSWHSPHFSSPVSPRAVLMAGRRGKGFAASVGSDAHGDILARATCVRPVSIGPVSRTRRLRREAESRAAKIDMLA